MTPRLAWHGYRGGVRQIEVFRNPRKHQTKMSRYIMFRCSNSSSEAHPTEEDALIRANRLNTELEWRQEPYEE